MGSNFIKLFFTFCTLRFCKDTLSWKIFIVTFPTWLVPWNPPQAESIKLVSSSLFLLLLCNKLGARLRRRRKSQGNSVEVGESGKINTRDTAYPVFAHVFCILRRTLYHQVVWDSQTFWTNKFVLCLPGFRHSLCSANSVFKNSL